MRWIRELERFLLVIGLAMLAFYVGARVHRAVLSRAEVKRFETERISVKDGTRRVELLAAKPNFSLWSQKRVKDYEDSLAQQFAPASAVLRISKINVEVPLLEGTDDLTLNRGVGRIPGTGTVGTDGNIGIAGHRDGFFRGLKDIGLGDSIVLLTANGNETYIIDRIFITDPSDVSALSPRTRPSLTLVTCYPFYFVGSAPKRFIVQATIASSGPTMANAPARLHDEAKNVSQQEARR
jgi:sortase A